jgi:hypothetical protein
MQITYTSKLNENVFSELESVAQRFKKSKREIIETALEQYFEQIRKAEYITSFKRAKGDAEQVILAEAGLDDFLKMVSE